MAPTAAELQLRVDRDDDLAIGAQLARLLSERVQAGTLGPGDRLPSVRDLAAEVGVNVNTARAVYGRLEQEGLVRSEQGRGTFVAETRPEGPATRQALRRQIADLEAALVRHRRLGTADPAGQPDARGGRLLTTEELAEVRDRLLQRVAELDTERAEVMRRLEELDGEAASPAPDRSERRSSVSLRGARVRWVGAS